MLRFAILFVFAFASVSYADVVSPDQEACFDKKVGDSCTTCTGAIDSAMCGTCVAPPPSCQAGACRRFANQEQCLAEPGCSWESGRPVCAGAACACNQVPGAAKAEAKASSCAAGAPVSLSALAVAVALALLRRGRRGGLPH